MAQSDQTWIRVDTENLCVAALAEILTHLRRAHEEPMQWLWVLSALKLALQTFIVGSFGTAAALEAMPQKTAEKHLRAVRESDIPYPNPWMRPTLDLYEYAKERHAWAPDPEIDDAVDRLSKLRNDFEHFLPKAWSIEIAGLPTITRSTLAAIGELGWGRARALPWHSDHDLDQCRKLHSDILAELARMSDPRS